MAAPTIYKYDDSNAPVMRGQREALIEVLTACLVDGYGSKQGAGWTRPFINADGTKAAFRNDPTAGSGLFLQVDGTYGGVNQNALMGYEMMTDVDNGSFPFIAESRYIMSSQWGNTTPIPWLLIADHRFFILFIWTTFTTTSIDGQAPAAGICFFGDGISVHASDPYFCMLFGSRVGYSGQSHLNEAVGRGISTFVSGQNQVDIAVARNSAGDAGYCYPYLCAGGGPTNDAKPGVGNGYPPVNSRKIFTRHYLNDAAAYSLRGYIPGLWAPCFSLSDADNFETIVVDGHQFYSVHHGIQGQNSLSLIDISDNWRP